MGTDFSPLSFKRDPIPVMAGVGLRNPHLLHFVEGEAQSAWVEIHAENYFCEGSPRFEGLLAVREHYPVSIHGVGLSLGSADGISDSHLHKLKRLCDLIEPGLVSEHLSWSITDGSYLNDLLPLPLTEESFGIFKDNINKTQDVLGRQILVENPSIYLSFEQSKIPETDFLNNLADQTGCGILLDVNNVFVSCQNTQGNPLNYLKDINFSHVGEIHVAGHAQEIINGDPVLIDTHGEAVCDEVWALLGWVLSHKGRAPILMEWDTNIPDFPILMAEVAKAQALLDRLEAKAHVA